MDVCTTSVVPNIVVSTHNRPTKAEGVIVNLDTTAEYVDTQKYTAPYADRPYQKSYRRVCRYDKNCHSVCRYAKFYRRVCR